MSIADLEYPANLPNTEYDLYVNSIHANHIFGPVDTITLAPVPIPGNPNANGATLTGSVLNLEQASGSFPGVVTTGAQNFAGPKLFFDSVGLSDTATSAIGVLNQNGIPFYHNYSTSGTKSNCYLGRSSGNFTNSGLANTIVGVTSGNAITSGLRNTVIGFNSGQGITTGLSNTIIGDIAGNTIVGGTGNIIINNTGVAGDTQTIRIGSSQTKAFIAGINGQPVAAGGLAVVCDSTGKLGTVPVLSGQYEQLISPGNCGTDGGAANVPLTAGTVPTAYISTVGNVFSILAPGIFIFSLQMQSMSPSTAYLTSITKNGVADNSASTLMGLTISGVENALNQTYQLTCTVGQTVGFVIRGKDQIGTTVPSWSTGGKINVTYIAQIP